MTDFENIKVQWLQKDIPEIPPDGAAKVMDRARRIIRKQLATKVILSSVLLVLVFFFVYVSAYNHTRASLGLALMIGCLLVRVVAEFLFAFRKKYVLFSLDASGFARKLKRYYRSKLYINYVLTPVLFAGYMIGFTLLLPVFKNTLSPGFYTYILYSSWMIFGILAVFIGFQVRRELRNIREMGW